MKRFWVTCASLVGIYALLSLVYDGCVVWLMRHSPSCNATKIERAVNGGEGESVAIFGSSRALGNFMPSIIVTNAFNYGVNGMSLNETLLLLDQYLSHNSSDSIIIINLDPWGFANPEKLRLAGDYRLVGRRQTVRATITGLNLLWSDWVPGFRFQGQLRKLLSKYLNARKACTKKVDNGAELLLNSRTESEWEVIKKGLKPYSFFSNTVCDEQVATLYRKQQAHRIVWVVAPTCSAHHALHQNKQNMITFLKWQDKYPNVSVVNFFDSVPDYPDTFFSDPTHFNVKGAEKFTRALTHLLGLTTKTSL